MTHYLRTLNLSVLKQKCCSFWLLRRIANKDFANQKRRFSVANKDLANQERRFSVTNKYLANQKRRFSADMYSTCRWTDRRWDVKCVVILHPVTLGGGTLPRKQHDFPKGDPTTCDTPQPQATLQQNVKMFVNWRRAPDPGPAT